MLELSPARSLPAIARCADWLRRKADSDFVYDLRRSPAAMAALFFMLAMFAGAAFAPWIAPHTPFDPATVRLMDALNPPAWMDGGDRRFLLGTDDQGRDIVSTILYGSRISLFVGFASVGLGAAVGIAIGLACGWAGGWFDALMMRIADIQMSLPDIMLALLFSGIARAALPRELHADVAVWVLIFAIAASNWPQYARVVRASTLAAREKEYVQAAQIIDVSPVRILLGHVLPNVVSPLLVVSTVGLAFAILAEAALSFVGIGMPPTQPTLGALIRIGNNFLFSGEWWISLVPSFTLLVLALSVNVFGDWLRDALAPGRR
jgi:peptide/nickel transport system permease protein